ncbi:MULTISPECIES: hypothetical protein [Pseudomonadota]|uniref:Extradiol ring-cleavage dioxygenase LigAB LigA subunit domain-containing protein n=1 Tax=Advenella alkanexedens TaxID=1481665 RepID=A0ABS6NMD5_9BURK|nr:MULTISPECIES: hypothetical protein [Advenella]MBV4396787.1 hypothetical protein [Advenella alkanexedens]MDD3758723.1 hypothetical protein [Advenella sp.]
MMNTKSQDIQKKLGPRITLKGLCPLTTERAERGYRLTKFLTSMRSVKQRTFFLNNEESCMDRFGLNDQEKEMVRNRAFTKMMEYGACTVAIGKANGAFKTSLMERGASELGMTVDEFVRIRKEANKGYIWQS